MGSPEHLLGYKGGGVESQEHLLGNKEGSQGARQLEY